MMQRMTVIPVKPPPKKLDFRTRFLRNPCDDRLSKLTLLKHALDKKMAKELLLQLNKSYMLKKNEHNEPRFSDSDLSLSKVLLQNP